ncbi:hypothetical protein SeMB42_g03923 [Synchytrium endobioticum]|uniref:ER membrane protein complex subunit 1 n=1 Tax=Synchytrium endobioticum TaxID=286115 RepID=A0A507CX46_9FUNG|nr:hypothetical protein SeLEV6574_g04950 [Synchytrium endobioticum]TPX45655.1 hypothetical protein SeMB42_g03923 [Synchytrium endobioticum]
MQPLALLLSFLSLNLCYAIYPDEIGVYDWLKPLVGTPIHVSFGDNHLQDLIHVATSCNVVAAIDGASSAIVWRRVLSPSDQIHSMKSSNYGILTLSGASRPYLRLWNAESGYLIWERTFDGSETSCNGFDLTLVDGNAAYILSNGVLASKVDLTTGGIDWSVSPSQAPTCYSRLIYNDNAVTLAGSTSNITTGSLTTVTLDVKEGGTKSKPLIVTDSQLATPFNFVLAGQGDELFAAYVDNTGKAWISNLESGRSVLLDSSAFSKDKSTISGVTAVSSETLRRELLLHTTVGSILLVEANKRGVELLRVLKSPGFPTTSALQTVSSGDEFQFILVDHKNLSSLTVEMTGEAKTSDKATVSFDANRYGTISKVFATHNSRMIAISLDGSVHYIKDHKLAWTREEALAHINHSEFLELPVSSHLSEELDEMDEPASKSAATNPFTRYARRFSTHLRRLSGLVNQFVSPAAPKESMTEPEKATRDSYSFRKFLVVTTLTGKVAAVETEAGDVVWARMMGIGDGAIVAVETLRTSLVKYPPVLAVVTVNDTSTTIHQLNGLTGECIAEESNLGTVTDRVILLPIETTSERHHVLALVDEDANVRLHPTTDDTINQFERSRPTFVVVKGLQPGSKYVSGYALSSFNRSKGCFEPIQMWELVLPEGEIIHAVGEKERHDNIASIGRVLGNRAVLYKYLNPNELSFVTLKSTGSSSTVSIYVLDGVAGTLLHHAVHYGGGVIDSAVPTIRIIQRENWIVYTYWNHGPDAVDSDVVEAAETAAKQAKSKYSKKKNAVNIPDVKSMEVVVLELFESSTQDQRFDGDTFSSFDGLRPDILSQAYQYPAVITGMGVTKTRAGISTREIIIGTLSNQVYALNKQILDPRRPVTPPTADDKEEGLLQYAGYINQNPREVVSYHREIAGVKHVVSAPSILESTSIVVAYGLDIFCLRQAPSKTFDLLSEDFNRVNLIVTMIGLAVAIYVVRYFNQSKSLSIAWK